MYKLRLNSNYFFCHGFCVSLNALISIEFTDYHILISAQRRAWHIRDADYWSEGDTKDNGGENTGAGTGNQRTEEGKKQRFMYCKVALLIIRKS